jgi:hypothetical protein
MAVVEWIDLASDTDKWRAGVRAVRCGEFAEQLSNCHIIKMDSLLTAISQVCSDRHQLTQLRMTSIGQYDFSLFDAVY